jgi:hypothetical protein
MSNLTELTKSLSHCKFVDCTLRASFGIPGQKASHCKKHALDSMTNVVSPRCEYSECNAIPGFGSVGGKGKFCKTHAEPGMIDVKNKRCEHSDCKTRATYGKNDNKAQFCIIHKIDGMIDVKNKRCEHSGCNKRPICGLPGIKPSLCTQHRKVGMLRHPTARCKHPNCKDHALYGKDLQPSRCEAHKLADELNLVERECKSCNLPMVLNKNNLCENCDPVIFQRATLVKQRQVMAYLDAHGLMGTSTDRTIDRGVCGKERPDRVYELPTHVIIVEVDEHQHNDRPCECEQTRMINVSQSFGGLPIVWIRFNPDEYKPSRTGTLQKPLQARLKMLAKTIQFAIDNLDKVKTAFIQVIHLYFDGWKESHVNLLETLVGWDK